MSIISLSLFQTLLNKPQLLTTTKKKSKGDWWRIFSPFISSYRQCWQKWLGICSEVYHTGCTDTDTHLAASFQMKHMLIHTWLSEIC